MPLLRGPAMKLGQMLSLQTGILPDEALAELVRRYFTSHGPALVQDFVWWSGLRMVDARAGLRVAGYGDPFERRAAENYRDRYTNAITPEQQSDFAEWLRRIDPSVARG